MSHNLDTTDGVVSYVDSRGDAWHTLGQNAQGCFTAEEAMEQGHLGGWNLRKEELRSQVVGLDGEVHDILVPERYAAVRDNPITQVPEALGVVGKVYHFLQNEDMAGLLNNLVDQSGATFETAGATDGGRQVFITMKLPEHINVGGVDRVDQYLAATTRHDGGAATSIMVTPVRIVCQNTLNLAFKDATNLYRVRHTKGNNKILVAEARQALDFSWNYLNGFHQEAEQLINTTLTQAKFEEIIEREFGPGEDAAKATATRAAGRLETMKMLFADANTQEGIRDTAWAGLNALTEYWDHFSPVRGVAPGKEAEVRSRKAIMDTAFKDRARQIMMELV